MDDPTRCGLKQKLCGGDQSSVAGKHGGSRSPSHYVFLLITQEMPSSPFLQPAGHVRGLIRNDCARDSGLGAKVSASHFRDQMKEGIHDRDRGSGTKLLPWSLCVCIASDDPLPKEK